MTDNLFESEVHDHPRTDEVREIFARLARVDPEDDRDLGMLVVSDSAFPVALATKDSVHIPTDCLDLYDIDELAFALAYGIEMNPVDAFWEEAQIEEASEKWEDSTIAFLVGVSSGVRGVWRYGTRFAERERDAIASAVQWIYLAGYDPNAGVSMFLKSSGWASRAAQEQTPKNPTWGQKLKAGAAALVFAPIGGAFAAAIKEDMPLIHAEERAAAVRAACVAAGFADQVG